MHLPALENFAMKVHLIDSPFRFVAVTRLDYQIVDRQSAAGADSNRIFDQFVRGQSHGGNSSLRGAAGPVG